ncbi:MAG: hypothetical protein ACC660_00895 [Acidimicrobiales bacterium]
MLAALASSSSFNVVAGISWEPEIRGVLIVLVAATVLLGSIWLILATDIGSRVGTLLALAGFFGWIFIMGLVWWIYGGNVLRGDDPSWVPEEIVFGDLNTSVVGNASDLADAQLPAAAELVGAVCPGLVDATAELERAQLVEDNLDIPLSDFYSAPAGTSDCTVEVGELLAVDSETIAETLTVNNAALDPGDPRFLDDAELDVAIDTAIADETRRLAQLTLSGLLSVAPDMLADAEESGVLVLRGWNLVSSAEAGEAQATAGAFLVEEGVYGGPEAFFILDTFQQGGKPPRSGESVWDRVANEVYNTIVFWHPTNATVVQVAGTLEKDPVPGQAPPFPEIDADAQVVSVVMVRDLGTRRLPAALITIGAFTIFMVLSWMLHLRDVELRRRTAEWDPDATT